ncbi:TrkH family potassium uptake protein [Thiotrichales bacterium 19S3-7]|nr:TrkH family potassium uptake protein [Thiotrichales bacterium 19S3-7]MCF6801662.1 TrkH family potassium uptake protein [Thiotrichales bacterium 19S3-11]
MPVRTLFSQKKSHTVLLPPPAILIIMYGICIGLGALLLMLPISSNASTSWYDALFTAVSAVTVTGLAVVDTGTHFTLFGQIVIAILIQLGGLGLMTFAVLILTALGMRIPIRKQILLREDLNHTNLGSLVRLVWVILKVVIVLEIVGAILLAYRFIPIFGWQEGIWHAIFHSISALNNAGFGLLPDSLSRWVGDPLINLVIPGLFIIGGLGYSVLSDINEKRRWKTLTLHSKLMLSGSLVLIVWGMFAFMLLEWHNPKTLAALDSNSARIWASWFQSVTTRTAGFNTVDIGSLYDSTSLMMIPLMFIGGGSTSTAGGIKVTTFILLMLSVVAFLKRQDHVSIFNRSLSIEQMLKVLALVSISLLITITGLFVITISNHESFIDLAFEVFSAFGTVGLSRGVTTNLDSVGRLVIIIIMFFGRVGPLALGFFLATKSTPRVRYPAGQVFLG